MFLRPSSREIHLLGLTRVAVFGDERAGGGFDIGYNSGRRSEFRVGYELFEGN